MAIGFIGLAEKEFIDQFPSSFDEELDYIDYVDISKTLIKKLKSEDKCDYIIALTHMRGPNDRKLAREVPEIDLMLGGHDHIYH